MFRVSTPFLIIISVIALSFIFLPKPAEAFLGFGGRILHVAPCADGTLLTIGPPRPGLFMWMPGTLTFSWYQQWRPGPWALGIYFPGGTCVCPYYQCWAPPIPALGTMITIGTSAL